MARAVHLEVGSPLPASQEQRDLAAVAREFDSYRSAVKRVHALQARRLSRLAAARRTAARDANRASQTLVFALDRAAYAEDQLQCIWADFRSELDKQRAEKQRLRTEKRQLQVELDGATGGAEASDASVALPSGDAQFREILESETARFTAVSEQLQGQRDRAEHMAAENKRLLGLSEEQWERERRFRDELDDAASAQAVAVSQLREMHTLSRDGQLRPEDATILLQLCADRLSGLVSSSNDVEAWASEEAGVLLPLAERLPSRCPPAQDPAAGPDEGFDAPEQARDLLQYENQAREVEWRLSLMTEGAQHRPATAEDSRSNLLLPNSSASLGSHRSMSKDAPSNPEVDRLVQDLTDENEKLKAELRLAEASSGGTSTEATALRAELKVLQHRCSCYTSEHAELSLRLGNLEAEASKSRKEKREINLQLSKERSELLARNEEIAHQRAALQRLEQSLQAAQSQVAAGAPVRDSLKQMSSPDRLEQTWSGPPVAVRPPPQEPAATDERPVRGGAAAEAMEKLSQLRARKEMKEIAAAEGSPPEPIHAPRGYPSESYTSAISGGQQERQVMGQLAKQRKEISALHQKIEVLEGQLKLEQARKGFAKVERQSTIAAPASATPQANIVDESWGAPQSMSSLSSRASS